jgi:hypothetical protein
MKLSEIAMCIKEMEKVRWQLYDMSSVPLSEVLEQLHGKKIPSEYFWINEFPHRSAFCHIFREFKVKGKNRCFCPMSCESSMHELKCGIVDEQDRVKPIPFVVSMIEDIPIVRIMKYLKTINIASQSHKLKGIQMWWYIVIRYRLGLYTSKTIAKAAPDVAKNSSN